MPAEIRELGDCCQFLDHLRKPVKESLRTSGPYPYYGANGQQGWIDKFLFDEPLVLLAEDGGHFGDRAKPIAYKISGKAWVNNHAHVIRPLPSCDLDYLAFALSIADASRLVTGSTRPKLTKAAAECIRLPMPALSEQRAIARRLKLADRLRSVRRYAFDLSGGLLGTVFAEFGISRAPRRSLQECCARITDGTHLTPAFQKTGIPFIFVSNISNGNIDFKTDKYISIETYNALRKHCALDPGDILYTSVGATYGQAAMVDGFTRFAFQRHIAHLKPDAEVVNPVFLSSVMQLPLVKRQADQWARGAAQPTINLSELRSFRVPVPTMEVQDRLVDKARQLVAVRLLQDESIRQADHLYQTLMREAFGEG